MKQQYPMTLERQMNIAGFAVAFSTLAMAAGLFLAFEAHLI